MYMENIKISQVCGLCAGCNYAIKTAVEELNKGNSVTIFKEIVHNKNVNNYLASLGAKFEEDINKLSSNDTIIIRAHGEPPSTYNFLNKNNIKYKDCTCHNVKEIHNLVRKYSDNDYKIIIIGKLQHPEVLGTIGWANDAVVIESEDDLIKINNYKNINVYIACQTTFNMNKANNLIEKIDVILKQNNCNVVINKSICSAQKVINEYSLKLAKESDIMIVVGGLKSSNSRELYNNISEACPSIFIEDIYSYKEALKEKGLSINKSTKIGITAGASTMKEELIELKNLIQSELK